MADSSLHTTQLRDWQARVQAGDLAARDELLRAVCGRLERLARKMLRDFARLRPDYDTDIVLNNTLLRLTRALEQVEIRSVREFFGLAALNIRRELLDLARSCARQDAQFDSWPGQQSPDASTASFQPADPHADPADLELWSAFHQEIEQLPADEREVVGLIFYHGCTHREAAELLAVSEKWIQRRWSAACATLHKALNGRLPEVGGD